MSETDKDMVKTEDKSEHAANVSLVKFLETLMKQDFYGSIELNFRDGIFTTLEQFRRTMNVESIQSQIEAYDKITG